MEQILGEIHCAHRTYHYVNIDFLGTGGASARPNRTFVEDYEDMAHLHCLLWLTLIWVVVVTSLTYFASFGNKFLSQVLSSNQCHYDHFQCSSTAVTQQRWLERYKDSNHRSNQLSIHNSKIGNSVKLTYQISVYTTSFGEKKQMWCKPSPTFTKITKSSRQIK